jgi:PGF-CTERM protein
MEFDTARRLTGIIALVAIVMAAAVPTNAGAAPEIMSISALPAEPRSDEAITINATVVNLDNVTRVTITYCTDDVCSIPIVMNNDTGTFTYTFIENKFKPGSVDFEITVDYTVNTTYMSVSRNLTLVIAEGAPPPSDKDDSEDTPGFEAVIVVTALAAVVAIGRRKRM